MKKVTLIGLIFILIMTAEAQSNYVRLWKDIPGMKHERSKLYIREATDSIRNGAAIIICPGGSYHHLGMPHEGFKTAEWFNSIGVTAFVLRYRVSGQGYHHPAMIEDLQQAVHYVRTHWKEYALDTNKIGVIGFSAGGHLSLMGGAFSNEDFLARKNIASSVSLDPDFVISISPVVSMQDSLAHHRSRKSLLTNNYTIEERDKLSMELQIPDNMPPVFLLASKDDDVVNYRNSVVLSQALKQQKIKSTFLLYDTGGHGYGMKDTDFSKKTKWPELLHKWLKEIGIL